MEGGRGTRNYVRPNTKGGKRKRLSEKGKKERKTGNLKGSQIQKPGGRGKRGSSKEKKGHPLQKTQ